MKADSTESTLIIDFISKMALAYPFIRIRLINNGNILFSTPGKGDIYSNILTIHSKEMGNSDPFPGRRRWSYLRGVYQIPDIRKVIEKSNFLC